MIKGKLPIVSETNDSYYTENDDTQLKAFCSPLPKNRFGNSSKKQMPRRSNLGLQNFNPNIDASPIGDRYIPKRRGQDGNIVMYEINHDDSPPMVINREDFDNSWEYEEHKAAYTQKMKYEGVLRETFFGQQSPSKDFEQDCLEANLFISPQKADSKCERRPQKNKLLKFKKSRSNKENNQRHINNTLKLNEFRLQNLGTKNVEKVTKIYADRVLDAPNMVDDFYLNLLDWSDSNVLGIALGQNAYLMDVSSKQIE